jgi:hypothetical protein
MTWREDITTRRRLLTQGSGTLMILAIAAAAGHTGETRAAKASKSDLSYRDKPNEGKSCATCRLFSSTDPEKGLCAVVEGEVSRNGWCLAYTPHA